MSISKALLQNSEQPNPIHCLLWKVGIQQNINGRFVVLRFLIFAYLNISIFFPRNVLFAHEKRKKNNCRRENMGGEIKRKA